MHFSKSLLLSVYLSLSFAAASPSLAYDLSAQSPHHSVLRARGSCISCLKSPRPGSHTSKTSGRPSLGRASMDRKSVYADRSDPSGRTDHPPSVHPHGQVTLGGPNTLNFGHSAPEAARSANQPKSTVSERWARRLARLDRLGLEVPVNSGEATGPRSTSDLPGGRLFPRAAQPVFGMGSGNKLPFGLGRSKKAKFPEGGEATQCLGPSSKYCEENCYCNAIGVLACSKGRPTLTGDSRESPEALVLNKLLVKGMCAPTCRCIVLGRIKYQRLTPQELEHFSKIHSRPWGPDGPPGAPPGLRNGDVAGAGAGPGRAGGGGRGRQGGGQGAGQGAGPSGGPSAWLGT